MKIQDDFLNRLTKHQNFSLMYILSIPKYSMCPILPFFVFPRFGGSINLDFHDRLVYGILGGNHGQSFLKLFINFLEIKSNIEFLSSFGDFCDQRRML